MALLPKFFSASLTRLLVFKKTLAWALGRGVEPPVGDEVGGEGDTVTKSFLRKGRTDPTLGRTTPLPLPWRTPGPGGWGSSRRPLLSPERSG